MEAMEASTEAFTSFRPKMQIVQVAPIVESAKESPGRLWRVFESLFSTIHRSYAQLTFFVSPLETHTCRYRRREKGLRVKLLYEKYFKDVGREFDEFQVNTHLSKLRCWYFGIYYIGEFYLGGVLFLVYCKKVKCVGIFTLGGEF